MVQLWPFMNSSDIVEVEELPKPEFKEHARIFFFSFLIVGGGLVFETGA